MFTPEEKAEVIEYLKNVPGRVYLGCDSIRYKKNRQWWARYVTVLVVHINNMHGCKIFGYVEHEKDYDPKQDKPRLRLMNEVYKVAECYLDFGELLEDREVEIHLDVNPKLEHASSAVVSSAKGYIMGMTGITPLLKPVAFAASYAADAGARKDWYQRRPEE